MSNPIIESMVKLLLVLIMVSAAIITTRRDIITFFRTYRFQSLGIAALALLLFFAEKQEVLLYLALLTIISKGIIIPMILKKLQRQMNIHRDVEFHYLQPGGSLIVSLALLFISYTVLARPFLELRASTLFFVGAVLGFSLLLIGMLIMFSRKMLITKIIGYLTMENGAVLFSLFIIELPFLIEVFIVMDLIMLVVITAILVFGIDSSIEEFHARLDPFRRWFGGEDE